LSLKSAAILASLIAILFCGCLPKEDVPLDAPILRSYEAALPAVVAVARGDIIEVAKVSLTERPLQSSSLSFGLSGYFVERIAVSVGDAVKKGDVLAELENTDIDISLIDAEFDVKSAEAAYGSDYSDVSKKQLEIAKLKLSNLSAEREKRRIIAPIDGVVTFVKSISSTGRSVAGEQVITISDNSQVVYEASGSNAKYLAAGSEYTIDFGGEIRENAIAEQSENGALLFFPEIAVPPKFASITVTVAERKNVLYVPNKAVKLTNEGYAVYRIDANGLRYVVPVETGLRASGKVEILSGLQEGDEVVIG